MARAASTRVKRERIEGLPGTLVRDSRQKNGFSMLETCRLGALLGAGVLRIPSVIRRCLGMSK